MIKHVITGTHKEVTGALIRQMEGLGLKRVMPTRYLKAQGVMSNHLTRTEKLKIFLEKKGIQKASSNNVARFYSDILPISNINKWRFNGPDLLYWDGDKFIGFEIKPVDISIGEIEKGIGQCALSTASDIHSFLVLSLDTWNSVSYIISRLGWLGIMAYDTRLRFMVVKQPVGISFPLGVEILPDL